MPRGILTKNDIVSRVLKIRMSIDEGKLYPEWSDAEKNSARKIINKILDEVNEYAR